MRLACRAFPGGPLHPFAPRLLAPLLAPLLVVAVACTPEGGGRASTDVSVFAAASLTDAFADLAEAFVDAHPDIEVDLNLAGSSSLAQQVLAGAPADVFASASPATMDVVVAEGAASSPVAFATNPLQIVVPAGNPGGVTGLADFERDELLLGLCAAEVPCGELARRALDAAGVTPAHDTDEPDVRALLAKVVHGELDAALVYRTDVLAEGDAVEGIALPTGVEVTARYPIAVLTGAPAPDAAAAFVGFVLSDEGQAILSAHGFGRP